MKFKYILILFWVSPMLLFSQKFLTEVFNFQRQAFCPEISKSEDVKFPYVVRCKAETVWGLRKNSIKLDDGKNALIMRNLLTDQNKIIIVDSRINKKEGFDISKNTLFVSKGQTHYVFSIKESNRMDTIEVVLQNKFATKNYLFNKHLKFVNDTLWVLMSRPDFDLSTDSSSISLCYLDERNQLSDKRYLPSPSGLYCDFFEPHSCIDISESYILSSDRTKYHIYIYDRNINIIDSISKDWQIPNYLSSEMLRSIEDSIGTQKLQFNNVFNVIRKNELFGKINILTKANFINDSLILVAYQEPQGGDIFDNSTFYDIWLKSNEQWKLIDSRIENYLPEKFGKISNSKIFTYSSYIVGNNYMFFTAKIPFIIEEEITYEVFQKRKNEYYLDHSDPNGFFIFSY